MKAMLAALLVIIAVAGYASPVSAAGPAVLAFAPVDSSAHNGDAVLVDVTIENIDADPGLAEYDLTLQVDPAIVQINSFADAGFITTGQGIVVCVPGAIDNTAGTAVATCTAVPLFGLPGISTTSSVALLHASFTALSPGTSPLTLSGTLGGPTGTTIPATFGSGTISVTAPTAAASPTAKPSTTPTPAVSSTAPVQTSTALPTAQLPAVSNTPEPASPTAAVLKAPQTGSGQTGGGTPWGLLAGGFVVGGGMLGLASYAIWRRRGAQSRN